MMTMMRGEQIDELMERASEQLAEMDYFEAERLCMKALTAARRLRDYERLARICMPLQEARRQRFMQAIDATQSIVIIDDQKELPDEVAPGSYIIDPLRVAADARALRMKALEQQSPIAVLCREPVTSVGLQPIVALGEVVVRTKIRPARKHDKPTIEWFLEALETLGDEAIEEIDPAIQGERRVDALLARLDALPEHEKLHQTLAEAAHETANALAAQHASE